MISAPSASKIAPKNQRKQRSARVRHISKNHKGGFPYMLPNNDSSHHNNGKYSVSFFKNPLKYLHDHVMFLNNSKFFAGVIMILLNVGSKFISIQFSKSTEEYLKYTLSKQILVFAMAWMASRDIYTALVLTAVFVVLSEHLFNEDSSLCVVPHANRILHKLDAASKESDKVTEEDLSGAIAILEKAKKEKSEQVQHDARNKYKDLKINNQNSSSETGSWGTGSWGQNK